MSLKMKQRLRFDFLSVYEDFKLVITASLLDVQIRKRVLGKMKLYLQVLYLTPG